MFVFYTGRSQFKLAEVFANTVTRQVMLSGEIGETPPIETFLADTKTCGDIMRGFRVSSAETPIVAAGRSAIICTLPRLYTDAQKSMSMRLIILLRCADVLTLVELYQVWRQPLCRR